MDFHLLLPTEAAALIGLATTKVHELIDTGKLGAFRDEDQWWIPLRCLAMYAGDDFEVDAACALAELIKDEGALDRTFAEHPEAVERIESSIFSPGSVGACLKQALIMSRRTPSPPAAGL